MTTISSEMSWSARKANFHAILGGQNSICTPEFITPSGERASVTLSRSTSGYLFCLEFGASGVNGEVSVDTYAFDLEGRFLHCVKRICTVMNWEGGNADARASGFVNHTKYADRILEGMIIAQRWHQPASVAPSLCLGERLFDLAQHSIGDGVSCPAGYGDSTGLASDSELLQRILGRNQPFTDSDQWLALMDGLSSARLELLRDQMNAEPELFNVDPICIIVQGSDGKTWCLEVSPDESSEEKLSAVLSALSDDQLLKMCSSRESSGCKLDISPGTYGRLDRLKSPFRIRQRVFAAVEQVKDWIHFILPGKSEQGSTPGGDTNPYASLQ